jgi:hypothetical protein
MYGFGSNMLPAHHLLLYMYPAHAHFVFVDSAETTSVKRGQAAGDQPTDVCVGGCGTQMQQQLHQGAPTAPDLSAGPTRMSTVLQELPHALYAEEVLMYHRATSRLIELCSGL